MLARDGLCAQGDHQGEEAGAGEQHDGEVEVMHAAQERRARGGPDAAARPKGELGNEARQAYQQATDQSPEGALRGRGRQPAVMPMPCPRLSLYSCSPSH